jgi:glycosyltransferase involved in cell wall biosynthesis
MLVVVPVLFASYSGLLGGAERVLLDCAARFPGDVVIACPPGPLAAAANAAGLAHARIASGSRRLRPADGHSRATAARHAAGLARAGWEVAGLVHRHRPAALVAWGSRAVLATAAIPRRPPTIAVLHDIHGGPVAMAVDAAANRAQAIVAASRAVARDLDATILHPGVDLRAFAPTPLPPGPPKALFLGALVAWKRPDLAVAIARRMPELQLTIAGAPLAGEQEPTLDAPANVTFAGHVDARAALARVHVLLHCADAEPFGLALVEALACGRPVVAPDAAGPREIVTDGAGRLYPPGDADAAAAALRAVLADDRAAEAARRRAETFDVNASAARFAAAVDAAMSAGARR